MASPDPTGGGVGEAAKELLQEMQKAQAEMQQIETPEAAGPNQAFQQALQQAQSTQSTQQVIEAKNAQQTKAAQSATEVLKRAQSDVTSTDSTQVVGQAENTAKSKLAGMLSNLIKGQDKMNEVMKMALSGRQFSPPELIVMQAGVYRFTQELELTSKVVEKATSGIKQTMNTQV